MSNKLFLQGQKGEDSLYSLHSYKVRLDTTDEIGAFLIIV